MYNQHNVVQSQPKCISLVSNYFRFIQEQGHDNREAIELLQELGQHIVVLQLSTMIINAAILPTKVDFFM